MDVSKMKNIIVLKNLPSNIVDEAIVILKSNQKIKKLEYIDREEKQSSKQIENNEVLISQEYVIKEAQDVIATYISKIENNAEKGNKTIYQLQDKYKKMRRFNIFLLACTFMSIIFTFFV